MLVMHFTASSFHSRAAWPKFTVSLYQKPTRRQTAVHLLPAGCAPARDVQLKHRQRGVVRAQPQNFLYLPCISSELARANRRCNFQTSTRTTNITRRTFGREKAIQALMSILHRLLGDTQLLLCFSYSTVDLQILSERESKTKIPNALLMIGLDK
jgi:hypothetical protein